jgi:hypothetical protein
MWMATKKPAVVIFSSSYKLTMSTTDLFIVLSVRKLISSRPDISFSMVERSHKSSITFVSSNFTGSIQKVVLNPFAIVENKFVLNKSTSGPFIGLNCPAVDYGQFKALGFTYPIIDMVRRILLTSASLYVPSHNFFWIIISKYNTSSVPQRSLRDAVSAVITKFASSLTSSHLWNSETRFFFKFGRVKPYDLLLLFDVCAFWFDSHIYPGSSDFCTSWKLPADFVHPMFLMR